MTTPITLHADAFWISPYAFTCFVALREKGVRFDVVEVGLHKKEQLRPEYQAHALTGRIPALVHGDFWLTESLAILEYLEDTFLPPRHTSLLPKDARERGRARQLLSWMRSDDTLPIRQERSAEVIFYDREVQPLSASAVRATTKLFDLAGRVVLSADRPALSTWTIVDAELAYLLQRLIRGGDAVPDVLAGYAETQWHRASVAAYVGHTRPPFVPYS